MELVNLDTKTLQEEIDKMMKGEVNAVAASLKIVIKANDELQQQVINMTETIKKEDEGLRLILEENKIVVDLLMLTYRVLEEEEKDLLATKNQKLAFLINQYREIFEHEKLEKGYTEYKAELAKHTPGSGEEN
jgi:hypothetical protein